MGTKIKPPLSEQEARAVLRENTDEVLRKFQSEAGALIEKVVMESKQGGDGLGRFVSIFLGARAILNAYVAELTYAKLGGER